MVTSEADKSLHMACGGCRDAVQNTDNAISCDKCLWLSFYWGTSI